MTTKSIDTDPKLFDQRLVERNLARGLITKKDYEKALSALPDDADHVDYTVIEDDDTCCDGDCEDEADDEEGE